MAQGPTELTLKPMQFCSRIHALNHSYNIYMKKKEKKKKKKKGTLATGRPIVSLHSGED